MIASIPTPAAYRVARALSALLAVFGMATTAMAAAPQTWTEYRNERYGFSLQYPADLFVTERTAEAGDGQVFAATDTDARLLVGALANDQRYTPAAYQDYIARHSYGQYQLGYRRLGQTWFVLSGEGNGRVFYEKVMFTCGGRLINSFAMIYPIDQRHIFDPVVERIEDTFRPARDCERAGFAPLPAPVRSPPPQYGPRSALADRIARARGYDVIVVLRRADRPYERRIVRGYVSRP